MISAHGTAATALEAGRLGAFRFIEKPLSKDYVLDAVREGLELGTLRQENQVLRSALEMRHQLVGGSPGAAADPRSGASGRADQRDGADPRRERRRARNWSRARFTAAASARASGSSRSTARPFRKT